MFSARINDWQKNFRGRETSINVIETLSNGDNFGNGQVFEYLRSTFLWYPHRRIQDCRLGGRLGTWSGVAVQTRGPLFDGKTIRWAPIPIAGMLILVCRHFRGAPLTFQVGTVTISGGVDRRGVKCPSFSLNASMGTPPVPNRRQINLNIPVIELRDHRRELSNDNTALADRKCTAISIRRGSVFTSFSYRVRSVLTHDFIYLQIQAVSLAFL